MSLVLIGYLIGLWLKPDFRPINRINMEAFVPALVFSSLVNMPLDTQQTPLLLAALVAVLLPGILMLLICRLGRWSFKTWAPLHMFRNSGNLAIPPVYLCVWRNRAPLCRVAVCGFYVSAH